MMPVEFLRLGVVMSLDALQYDVRVKGQRSGKTFYSEAIAIAWAKEEAARTGKTMQIREFQTW